MSADILNRFYEQMGQLKTRFMALQPRERLVIGAGTVLVLLTAIYTLGLAPLYKAVNERHARVTQKQQDLVWMQSVAARLNALSSTMPAASSGSESMVVLIANSATSGNVANALTGQTPEGPNGVRVRFENVPFDALVVWLGGLQKGYGIHVKAAEINRSAQPGLVNANLTLARGG
ncbi:MAG: type II secretion system protein GspM [Steroidobacteraceae bacterium]